MSTSTGTSKDKKRTQTIERHELEHMLAVARGDRPADLLIKNVQLLDLVNGGSEETHVAIAGQYIAGHGLDYESENILDAKGLTIVPGFIDGHLHIESSMMHPFEFERLTLPLGTTTAICDPHEITNVMGKDGFSWFLRCSEIMHQHLFVQVSSCVPALPGFETNGGGFYLDDMLSFKDHSNVIGLAEMMNFPGVINADANVLDKIEAFSDYGVDGHCPLVRGKQLNAYIAAGIKNCHETVTKEEALEKLQKGMSLIIREGSVAKNLNELSQVVTEFNSPQCFLCTDDRNPFEIFHEGHINYMVKKLINETKLEPHVAYRLASFSAAKHFGLKKLGLIAPGYRADFILLNDVNQVGIEDVYIAGNRVADLNLEGEIARKLELSNPPRQNTMVRETVKADDLQYNLEKGTYNVIKIVPEEIITEHLKIDYDGSKFAEDDVLKLAVIERYGNQLPPALGLVKGLGLKSGAIASSVAHDSHNIIVIGTDEKQMAAAANALIQSGGGFTVVENEQVKAQVDLPIAGLISLESAETISDGVKNLKTEFKKLGVVLDEPFLQMAFLALPVIPTLKITDKGLVDVTKFEFTELRC